MEFYPNRLIYLQIADLIIENIVTNVWLAHDRIPSVRDYGRTLKVNPNTIVKTYNYLQEKGIIYNKRGIGYFVCEDATKIVQQYRREEFIKDELPSFFKMIEILGIPFPELMKLYAEYRMKDSVQ